MHMYLYPWKHGRGHSLGWIVNGTQSKWPVAATAPKWVSLPTNSCQHVLDNTQYNANWEQGLSKEPAEDDGSGPE